MRVMIPCVTMHWLLLTNSDLIIKWLDESVHHRSLFTSVLSLFPIKSVESEAQKFNFIKYFSKVDFPLQRWGFQLALCQHVEEKQGNSQLFFSISLDLFFWKGPLIPPFCFRLPCPFVVNLELLKHCCPMDISTSGNNNTLTLYPTPLSNVELFVVSYRLL